MLGGRPEAFLHAGQQVRRAGAGVGHARLRGQPPERAGVRVHGAAVVEHHGGADEQAADQVVPHHPAGRGVPEERVRAGQILMQGERLEVLQDDAAMAVHDRLRQAGGAGGVQHPQRVRERHLGELELWLARVGWAEVVPAQLRHSGRQTGQPGAAAGTRAGAEVVHQDHGVQAGQLGGDGGQLGSPVEPLAAVGVAVDAEQDLRRDLREPVDHAARPEVRRARRPDRAQAGGREHRDQGLGRVRQVGGDPVAVADAKRRQPGPDPRRPPPAARRSSADRRARPRRL